MTIPSLHCPVVIPARNAEVSLPAVLRSIRSVLGEPRIFVVDDGSTDATRRVAIEAGVTVLSHEQNRGKGAALRTGIMEAFRTTSAEEVCTMDADGQHAAEDIPRLLEARARTNADLILGDRAVLGSAMPLARRMSNTITSFLVTARTGVRVPDSQCGFRLISRRCATVAMPRSDGFEAETEWILRAERAGLSIASVPVRTIYDGEISFMRGWETAKAFIRVLFREY